MIDIKLTSDGDLSFKNNDFQVIENEIEGINQQVYITLKTALGEFQPDDAMGLRQDNLFGRHIVIDYVKQDITDAITDQVDDIDSIDDVEVDLDMGNRIMNINVTYTTVNQEQGDFSNKIQIGGA